MAEPFQWTNGYKSSICTLTQAQCSYCSYAIFRKKMQWWQLYFHNILTHYGLNLYDYNLVRQLDWYLPHQNPWKSSKFPTVQTQHFRTQDSPTSLFSERENKFLMQFSHVRDSGVRSAGETRWKNRWVTQTGQTGPRFETWHLILRQYGKTCKAPCINSSPCFLRM